VCVNQENGAVFVCHTHEEDVHSFFFLEGQEIKIFVTEHQLYIHLLYYMHMSYTVEAEVPMIWLLPVSIKICSN
jgi:hypothetical protein